MGILDSLSGGVAAEGVRNLLSRRNARLDRRDQRSEAAAQEALSTVRDMEKQLHEHFTRTHRPVLDQETSDTVYARRRDLWMSVLLIQDRNVRDQISFVIGAFTDADLIAMSYGKYHETGIRLAVLSFAGEVLSAYLRGDKVPGPSGDVRKIKMEWDEAWRTVATAEGPAEPAASS